MGITTVNPNFNSADCISGITDKLIEKYYCKLTSEEIEKHWLEFPERTKTYLVQKHFNLCKNTKYRLLALLLYSDREQTSSASYTASVTSTRTNAIVVNMVVK